MTYHCPQCNKELKKGKYSQWVSWFIGPIFGQFLRPLLCDEHGKIDIETLSSDERNSAVNRKWIGIIAGGIVNIVILILIIVFALDS
jgi:hypothetical protein